MDEHYEAHALPHAFVLTHYPSKKVIRADFASLEEAQGVADVMNDWIKSKPNPHTLTPWPQYRNMDGTEAELVEIIDRMEDPERKLDILSAAVKTEAARLMAEAS